MQIKINFEKLFSSQQELNSTLQTPSSEIEHSYRTSLNHSFQQEFHLKQTLFEQAQEAQHIKSVPNQQHNEDVESILTKKSSSSKQSLSSIRSPQPGQRLYYQSQQSEMRKNKERERIQKERFAELKSMPFAPNINKNSRKLAQKVKVEPNLQAKGRPESKTTLELLQQQTLKECTFQPKLVAKNAKGQTKSKEELFYYLHNTSKIAQMKLSRKIQQQSNSCKPKKASKQVFTEFFKRIEEYNNAAKQKHQLMKQKASKYDLNTGEKLFSPKLIEHRFQHNLQKHSSSKNILASPKISEDISQKCSQNPHPNYFQQYSQKPQPKSKIFSKKARNDSYETAYKNYESYQSPQKHQTSYKEEEYYIQQYKQYSEQFDRRTAIKEVAHHEIIHQELQHSLHQQQVPGMRACQPQTVQKGSPKTAIQLQAQVENSQEGQPFEVSNAKQYITASEQDEPQPRNCVMEILNNLLGSGEGWQ